MARDWRCSDKSARKLMRLLSQVINLSNFLISEYDISKVKAMFRKQKKPKKKEEKKK